MAIADRRRRRPKRWVVGGWIPAAQLQGVAAIKEGQIEPFAIERQRGRLTAGDRGVAAAEIGPAIPAVASVAALVEPDAAGVADALDHDIDGGAGGDHRR